jgi:predicted metal-binding membrane protein
MQTVSPGPNRKRCLTENGACMSDPSPIADAAAGSPLTARELTAVAGGLAGVALAGWAYMAYMAWAMSNMDKVDMWMPPLVAAPWTAGDLLMLFVMWATMMVAMMTPSASPMVVMFATLNRKRRTSGQPYTATFVFVTGYLVAWTAFSVLAALVQWPLHASGLLDPMMHSRSYLMSGVVLMVAGLYQWTPLKDACLTSCRSPLAFLMTEWREGTAGGLVMGIRHGSYCVGCCWSLMLVLFAVGVMNMLWVLLITGFVVIEKVLPAPGPLRLLSGLVLLCWGGYWAGLYLVAQS